jgi:RIO kinase 1
MSGDLETLLAEGIISDVVARLKSGKEADVWIVRYGGRDVAAKVYKDHAMRSFKNNAAYKEGRSVRSSRSQRAIEKGTRFGRDAAEDAWKSAEVDALYKLHAGGVRVPTPVLYFEGVLLMELVLDAHGAAAPRVIDTPLTPEDANRAYHDMLGQLVRILCCDLIHGDLSPYNVLWAANGPTIIDFPQAVSAPYNSRAEFFFIRDAHNILGYFASIDRSLDARFGDAAEIWRAYTRRELTPDFLPRGRPLRMAPRPPMDRGRPPPDRGRPPHDRAPMNDRPRRELPPQDRQPRRKGPPPRRDGPPRNEGGGPRRPVMPEVIVRRRPPDLAPDGTIEPSSIGRGAPAAGSAGGGHGAASGAGSAPGRRRRRR